MEATQENIDWAMERLQAISHLPGGPALGPGIVGVAKAFLKILADQPGNTYYIEPPPDAEPDLLVRGVPVHVPGMTAKETGEWLIEHILDSCERFPQPIQMRRMYCEREWKCGDGEDAWDKVKALA